MPFGMILYSEAKKEAGSLTESLDDMNYEALAKKARYFKQDEKGVAAMCEIMEDMRNEAEQNKAKKTAVHLIKLGKMTLEEIAEATELSLDVVKELENQSMQLV